MRNLAHENPPDEPLWQQSGASLTEPLLPPILLPSEQDEHRGNPGIPALL